METIAPPRDASGPRHPIGVAAERLGVHPRTLMAWERIGLVRPERRSNRRMYSEPDLRWLGCVHAFNRQGGVSLQGLAVLLRFVPCWAVRSELEAGDGADCCPPRYPADSCLERVTRAYAGDDPPGACERCGVYRAGRDAGRAALRETVSGLAPAPPPNPNDPNER